MCVRSCQVLSLNDLFIYLFILLLLFYHRNSVQFQVYAFVLKKKEKKDLTQPEEDAFLCHAGKLKDAL